MPKKAPPKHEAHWEETKHPRATDGRFGDKAGDHTKTEKKPAAKKPAAKADTKGAKKDEKKAPKKPVTNRTGSAGTGTGKPKPASGTSKPGKATAAAGAGKKEADVKKPAPKPKGAKKDEGIPANGKRVSPASEAKKPKSPAKAEPAKEAGKAKPKAQPKVKDIRSEAQANRELAYDVGDKVGGARKDEYRQSFFDKPTPQNLSALEKLAPELAQITCVKKNILKPIDFEAEFKRGTDINVAMLKQLLYDRIAPKPKGDTSEDRMKYLSGIHELHRIISPIKSVGDLNSALGDLSRLARDGSRLAEANDKLNSMNSGRYSYINEDYYKEAKQKGEAAKKILDFSALGDKLENFFNSSDARSRTVQTVYAKKLSWDTYFKAPEPTEAKAPKEKGAQKKKWERMAVSEHARTGGKETTVKKPEDMVKQFNMKGVEFGNWVDDASGLFHLKRSAEAFHDLADVLGIDDKDISLNGRLSMAFGARGKSGALAHYEPDRKVINMTKFGGAGSLAHEWGHALDNIMYQYSHGGKGSIFLASEGNMGDHDPQLKSLYDHVIKSMTEPAPGEKGGVKKIKLDSSEKIQQTYYPQMRRDAESGMGAEELYHTWHTKLVGSIDREIKMVNSSQFRSQADKDKKTKSLLTKKTKELNALPHLVATELRYAKFGKGSAEHFQGEIEVSTGKSEYMTRMEEFDGTGKGYFSTNEEMFARVFESYIEDKMKTKKRKNNYLVWGTGAHVEAPFPIGEERKYMHNAMESLLYYIGKEKALKKALEDDLRKSLFEDGEVLSNPTKRYAYSVPKPEDAIYIPVNRLRMVYQTEAATNWDKVKENMDRMRAGEHLEPVIIGLDHDVHDGHHRWLAAKALDHTHVPCVVGAVNDMDKDGAVSRYRELWKSFFDEAQHPRDNAGRFMYHTTDNKDFKHDPTFDNRQQELGRGLYVSPGDNLLYWHKALKGENGSRKYVIPIDVSKANIAHTSEMPDQRQMSRDLIAHHGGDSKRALAAVQGEEPTGDTFGRNTHQIAVTRAWAKAQGYHGIATNDGTEGDQVVLFDDSAVHYHPAMDIDEFISKERHGLLKSLFDRLDLMKAQKFDESKHPRDGKGKFSRVSATNSKKMMVGHIPAAHREHLLNTLKYENEAFSFKTKFVDEFDPQGSKTINGRMYKEQDVQEAIAAYKKDPKLGKQFDKLNADKAAAEAKVKAESDKKAKAEAIKQAKDKVQADKQAAKDSIVAQGLKDGSIDLLDLFMNYDKTVSEAKKGTKAASKTTKAPKAEPTKKKPTAPKSEAKAPAPKTKADKAKAEAAKFRADMETYAKNPKPKAGKATTKADIEAFGKNPKAKQGKSATKKDLDDMLALNPKPKKAKETTKADLDAMLGSKSPSEDKITLFHGTKIVHAETIMQKGFKAQRSGHGDMGKCAYFKSPEWDKKEADDFAKTQRAVNYFAGHDADDSGGEAPIPGRVIKATIDRKHLLDCSKGRPKELQDMIDATRTHGRKDGTPRWDKNSSPYEAYAKKHGIKAIIDKLDTVWEDEGWQIGVYDPKIIQIMDTGKKLKGEGAKATLQKSASEADSPYCLLHHEFSEDGNLVLHIGAQ